MDSMHALNLTDRQKFFNKFGLTKQVSDVQLISSVQFTYKIYVLRKSYNKKIITAALTRSNYVSTFQFSVGSRTYMWLEKQFVTKKN